MKLTIIIENHDLHNAGPSQLHFLQILSINNGKLQEELLVWLPLIVIHNGDSNLK